MKILTMSPGTIKEVEPAHSDLLDKFKELREFCLTNVANKLTGDSRKAFIDKCHVYEIGFNTNTKGESAKIKATLGNGESQFSIIELPQTPFYSPDIEAHETGVVHTFGERLTKVLKGIQMEAKMYLGGKRGEMQTDMFGKGEDVKAV